MTDVLRQIVADVSNETGVSAERIMSGERKRFVARARWRVWARLAKLGWSTPQIGRPWGYDHTTIIHGLNMLGVRTTMYVPRGGEKPRPSKFMPDLLKESELRRAETIRQYWAAKGVNVNVEFIPGKDHRGRPVPRIKSVGIPVRGDI